MNKQVEVKLDFINKKGEEKHVRFYMEKQTYEILFDKSISEDFRKQYLIDEYHEYEKERYFKRKFLSIDSEMAESLGLIERITITSNETYDNENTINEIILAIKSLSDKQKEIITKVYLENKKQVEVAKELGVSKAFISKTISKAIDNLKKKMKNG